MLTTKGQKTLHPILVPLKVWSQIDIDLFGPLKEDSYRYIVISLDYKSKYVEAGLLKGIKIGM